MSNFGKNMVITLDKNRKPLGFCTERRARILMKKKRAFMPLKYPAVIVIKDADVREIPDLPNYRLKIDPGSEMTGMAIVKEETNEVMLSLHIHHRTGEIVKALETRRNARRNRRNREVRYRKSKYGDSSHPKKKNSHAAVDSPRPKGWIPPSVKSAGDNIINWARKRVPSKVHS